MHVGLGAAGMWDCRLLGGSGVVVDAIVAGGVSWTGAGGFVIYNRLARLVSARLLPFLSS